MHTTPTQNHPPSIEFMQTEKQYCATVYVYV